MIRTFLRWLPFTLVLAVMALGVITLRTEATNFTIVSGSMTPKIPVGAQVFIDRDATYRPGDIIAFHAQEGHTVVHRFLGYGDNRDVLTKGDANPTPDMWVKPVVSEDVIGKVVWSQPHYPTLLFVVLSLTLGLLTALLWFALLGNRGRRTEQDVQETDSASAPV